MENDECPQDAFQWPGDPNGHVTATPPAVCHDTVNNIDWVKDDGITSNVGWH